MTRPLDNPAAETASRAFLADINPQALETISQVFQRAVRLHAQKPAFTALGVTLSYADLDRYSAAFAAYLQAQGLEPGDRIGIQLPNLLQYPIAVFGALRAGLVVVNTNPLYTAQEMKHQFRDSGVRALVILAQCAARAEEILADTRIETLIITEVGDLHPPIKGWAINSVLRYIKRQVPPYDLPRAIGFKTALRRGARLALKEHQPGPDDLAVLQYTGGTTGVAKGAMLTQANLVANMLQLKAHFGEALREGQEVFVGPLPLYHIYAFTLHCMFLLETGNQSLLIPNPRDISGFVRELEKHTFTAFAGLNTLFVALVQNARFRALDFSNLRLTASGGMALTHEAARHWKDVTGCQVTEGYGLTETSPAVTFNRFGEEKTGSIGFPLPHTQVGIFDTDDQPVSPGLPGELWVRGPQVMRGYWQRPQETAAMLSPEGWLRTGDMAVAEADGSLRIVDRKKDMIIVSGFNVYPNEVEDVVAMLPQVRECALVGVPDPQCGEVPHLYLAVTEDGLTAESVRAHCRQHLAAYKVPREVHFRDELPKSPVGKVLRRALRQP